MEHQNKVGDNYTSGTLKIEANDCQLVDVVCVFGVGGVHESVVVAVKYLDH
jgi:hypothetical protein